MNLLFTEIAWKPYRHWQQTDQKIVTRINELIKSIQREPFKGLGKPEALRQNLRGYWSRRITSEHRLIYRIGDGKSGHRQVEIIACRFHYG